MNSIEQAGKELRQECSEARNKKLTEALEYIINDMRACAEDIWGNAEVAEGWETVKRAREALR